MYPGAMTDEAIRGIFQGAGDFIARELMCSGLRLYAYIDRRLGPPAPAPPALPPPV